MDVNEIIGEIIGTIIGVIIGGLITWAVSKWFYIKASEELKAVAVELRRLAELTLRSLEDAGLATLNKDDKGNIKGLVISIPFRSQGSTAVEMKYEGGHLAHPTEESK